MLQILVDLKDWRIILLNCLPLKNGYDVNAYVTQSWNAQAVLKSQKNACASETDATVMLACI